MSQVEDGAGLVHRLQKRAPVRGERPIGAGAMGVFRYAVVHQRDDPQAILPPQRQLRGLTMQSAPSVPRTKPNGGPPAAASATPAGAAVGLRSTGPVGWSCPRRAACQAAAARGIDSRADQAANTHTLELAIVGEHPLGSGVRDLVRAQARAVPGAVLHAGQHSGDAQPDVSPRISGKVTVLCPRLLPSITGLQPAVSATESIKSRLY